MRFRTLFLFFVLAELTSFVAYFYPVVSTVGFFLILLAALVLSFMRLEYGLYFVLAELILGGKGYLFSLQLGPTPISIRMGLFVVVMAVWLGKAITQMRTPSNSPSERGRKQMHFPPLLKGRLGGVIKWWGLFGLAIVWGFIVGLIRGNDFGNLFLDANGYFYATLILPFIWVMKNRDTSNFAAQNLEASHFLRVFLTATTWLAIKTLLAVYMFTHAGNNFIAANLIPFYRWVRDTGVGEITGLPGNFARVFFQSHIYNVAAFFVLLAAVIQKRRAGFYAPFSGTQGAALLILNAAVILISLSRSFWVGTFTGLVVLGFVLVKSRNPSQPPSPRLRESEAGLILRGGKILVSAIIGALVLLFIVARFPFPKPSPTDLTVAAQSRLEAGAAATSRWNLLPPLWRAVARHPIFGSGFGTTVTYISNDPRIREVNPTGEYTTYAFEWGWLDLWLKLGALGLILYLGLLFKLWCALFACARNHFLCLAGLGALAALAAINVFTPYLNHPLGFGILMLLTIIAFHDRVNKVVFST